jgi:AraC-like DNA-binding protein
MNTDQSKQADSRMARFAQFAPAGSNEEPVLPARTNPPSTAQGPGSTSDWERLAKEAGYNSSRMASLRGVSERHSQRLFKKHLGCSPTRWLRTLQCRLAKDLISQGYSSKAAAAELKFANDAHFCREFKKIFGVSPQKFAPNRSNHLTLSSLATLSSSFIGPLDRATR